MRPHDCGPFAPDDPNAGVAVLLAALALVELFTRGDVAAPDVALALLATVPVAWRNVAPRVALGLCVLALLILSALETDEFTVAELLALMLVTYTVALLESSTPAVAALVVVLAAALGNSAAASWSASCARLRSPVCWTHCRKRARRARIGRAGVSWCSERRP